MSRLLCALLFSLATALASAAPVENLYDVSEPVAGQQAEERTAALGRALATLVQRLTGSRAALDNADIQAALKAPEGFANQYGYRQQGEAVSLDVAFNPLLVDNLLRQAGVPVWGASRPAVLTWWLSQNADDTFALVGDGLEQAASLREGAQHAGLPLRLPLADLDEQLLATADVVGGQPQALEVASTRYNADARLAVVSKPNGAGVQATWQAWMGDWQVQGTAAGADNSALAKDIYQQLAAQLAGRFVASSASQGEFILVVHGVTELGRYAQLDRLLEPFAPRLLNANADRLTYRLQANREQLAAQLGLAGIVAAPEMAPQVQPGVDANGQPVLPAADSLGMAQHYRWP